MFRNVRRLIWGKLTAGSYSGATLVSHTGPPAAAVLHSLRDACAVGGSFLGRQRSSSQSAAAGHRLSWPMGGMPAREPFRVLFCGIEFPSAYELTKACLEQGPDGTAYQVDFVAREELPQRIGAYHFIVPRMARLSADLLASAKQARFICQFGVGLEGVDLEAARAAGIPVARISGTANKFNAISCAEHSIYLMLALLRKQNEMMRSVAAQRLGEPAGDTLWGKTALLVGFGAIGQQLALRLKGFNMRMLAVRRSEWAESPQVGAAAAGGEAGPGAAEALLDGKGRMGDLPALLPEADVVVLCCPVSKETVGMVDAAFYGAMKKGALLINIARGGLLDYDATLAALQEGDRLGGLGMDVAWHEPLDPADPVACHPRTIVTPHVGGVTMASYTEMAKIMSAAIRQVKGGEALTAVEIANHVSFPPDNRA